MMIPCNKAAAGYLVYIVHVTSLLHVVEVVEFEESRALPRCSFYGLLWHWKMLLTVKKHNVISSVTDNEKNEKVKSSVQFLE